MQNDHVDPPSTNEPASPRQRASEIFGPKAVVAVVEVADPSVAPRLAETLGEAGVDALEITARTDGAIDAIRAASAEAQLPVGAGTVTNIGVADAAADAGATFLVSPAFDLRVSEHCLEMNMTLLPGAITPTEVLNAHHHGFREVKVFPAAQFGGLSLVNALASIAPEVSFMPTGGVTHDRAIEYLAHPQVAAVGGTWIAPRNLIDAKDWTEIARRATAIVDALRDTDG